MSINILHDHLSGFDERRISSELMGTPDGKVQIEYILPNNIKNLYPHLEIQFSAFLMVRNNHFEKFLNLPEPSKVKRTNFLCSFNNSKHISRIHFVTRLFFNHWFNPDFCSKCFLITPDELCDVTNRKSKNDITTVSWEDTHRFIKTEYRRGDDTAGSNGQISRDLNDLSPLIQQSFITAVAETVASSYVPFPTEKICYPIANKSLWLAYAQPGYYKFIETHMDLKPFVGIDYSFDDVEDPYDRLDAYMSELKRIELLPEDQKADLYSLNQHVIDHNFIILTNGDMIANLWEFDECLEHYEEINNFSRIGGFRQQDIGASLIRQLVLIKQRQTIKEKRF